MSVISLRERLEQEQSARRQSSFQRPPAIFFIGVFMMVAVVGGLTLRSAVAGAKGAPGISATALVEAAAGSSAVGSSGHAARASSAPSASPYLGLTGYVWPLDNPVITLPFGPSDWGEFFVDGVRFHDGVDIASNCGDYVRAAHDGTVLAASRQYDDFMGWTSSLKPYYNLLDTKHWWNSLPIVIVLDDGDGYRSIYAHEYQVLVKPGQKVKAGQIIGYEGQTGNASGCHVHFGIFNPKETATFQLDPAVVSKDLMPAYEIARINPLLVLPFRCEFEEMRALRPAEALPCPPLASPSTAAKPGATANASRQP
jgi:murein DD-endopeptidase MepM/ murein hydrolase activator NlpD